MDTKCAHSVHGRPTLKDEECFRNGLVRKPYERSLYEKTFMSELFIEKHTISTELCNVNREKHKLKSHRVCRRDREPSRIPIRSLKSLRNKRRKVREFVYVRILSCFPMSSTLYCYVNAKNILRWLKTVSRTFQDVDFDGSLLPLFISWCYNHGIKTLPNHWWTRWFYFHDVIGYHSNTMTC